MFGLYIMAMLALDWLIYFQSQPKKLIINKIPKHDFDKFQLQICDWNIKLVVTRRQ